MQSYCHSLLSKLMLDCKMQMLMDAHSYENTYKYDCPCHKQGLQCLLFTEFHVNMHKANVRLRHNVEKYIDTYFFIKQTSL